MTYEDIAKDIKNGKFAPVYLLMGEEDYYIDRISDYIVEKALDENEREFNLTIMYGLDTDMASIVNNAKRYPMMSEHQVVVVKEAQNLRSWDELSFYMQKPLESTILVFCYKHGILDKRKKIVAEIEKKGVVFESKKLKENMLPTFISTYMKRKKIAKIVSVIIALLLAWGLIWSYSVTKIVKKNRGFNLYFSFTKFDNFYKLELSS